MTAPGVIAEFGRQPGLIPIGQILGRVIARLAEVQEVRDAS